MADENQVDHDAHADVAIDALESIVKHAGCKYRISLLHMLQQSHPMFLLVVRKTMVHLLGKLHLSDAGDERLEAINQLIEHINKV